jgi:arylsulfatase A-like enzyme
MRNLVLCLLLLAAAAGGPFLWAWLNVDSGGRAPVPLAVNGPASVPQAAEIDDVEPPVAANPLIQAMRRMLDDSPAFDEHGDDLREQLTQADVLLSRIKEENRQALASLRSGVSPRTRPRSRAGNPHVVLLDLGNISVDDLSCYSDQAEKTPLFDLLASQGVRFTSYYHSSLDLTEERSALLYAQGRQNRLDEPNLATSLVEAGYEASIIGNCSLAGDDPSQHGFDSWFGATTAAQANVFSPDVIESNGAKIKFAGEVGIEFDAQMIYVTEAISFAQRQRQGQSFFLWLSLPTPNSRFTAQEAAVKTAEDKRQLRRTQIKRLEVELAEFITELNRAGWAENTVLILTSLAARQSNSLDPVDLERRLRAPLIVLGPGRIKQDVVDDSLVCTSDLWSTIAELTGANCSANESVSFSHVLSGKRRAQQQSHPFLSWRVGKQRFVRFENWLYLRTEDKKSLLYDLEHHDAPAENVAGFHPQVVVRGKGFLAEADSE